MGDNTTNRFEDTSNHFGILSNAKVKLLQERKMNEEIRFDDGIEFEFNNGELPVEIGRITPDSKLSFLTSTKQHNWTPQPDITAYELALLLPILLVFATGGYTEKMIDELPDNAKRHLEEAK